MALTYALLALGSFEIPQFSDPGPDVMVLISDSMDALEYIRRS